MSLKSEYQLKKEIKIIQLECERLELENMKLRLDVERRVVEFMNQMQDFFGIVDSFFTEDDVRTLGEAKNKWHTFRDVLDETQDVSQALDAINRVSIATPEKNAKSLMNMWSKK
jgi:hypothetical protein